MLPEEPNPTAEEIDPTTEAIIEAIRAGYLVEATRALWMVFNSRSASGDVFHPEELVAFHPGVECTMRTELPDPRTYRGREEFASLTVEWIDMFDDFLVEPVAGRDLRERRGSRRGIAGQRAHRGQRPTGGDGRGPRDEPPRWDVQRGARVPHEE